MPSRRSPLLFVVSVAALSGVVTVYLRRPPALPGLVETLPPLPPDPSPTLALLPDFRPPQPSEVAAVMERAFPGAVPPEAVRTDSALTGDFNGDSSPDLVVPARPLAERLPVINGDLANWTLQDPSTPRLGPEPDPSAAPVVVGKDDMLLAVVHGHGAGGWRNPDARQAYLLKVSLEGKINVENKLAFLAQAVRSRRRVPYLRGDLISEVGGRRFLYWTGARYTWHPTPG